jgi:glycosyltransferase involved in cell wall biosynthesis
MIERPEDKCGGNSRVRVAVLTNIPTPYRLSFFNELANFCDLRVLFDNLSEPNRHWVLNRSDFRFSYKILKGLMIPYLRHSGFRERRFLQLGYAIIPQLVRLRPDVVISAEMGTRTLQAELYCRITGTPLILWWEGTQHTERVTPKWKLFIRKYLVGRACRFWTNGEESTANLQTYGADPAKIDTGMTGMDTIKLSSEVQMLLPKRTQIRSKLGLNGFVISFIGQIAERKGISQYLAALDLVYCRGLRNWSLLFVGTGDLDVDLRKWCDDHSEIAVAMTGFVQSDDLPKFLAAADGFVLPTLDDNWALATLEALAAGLPQLFSIYNGCTADLIIFQNAGRLIDPLKTQEFAASLREWIENPPMRLQWEQIDGILKYYSPAAMAQRGFISVKNATSLQ